MATQSQWLHSLFGAVSDANSLDELLDRVTNLPQGKTAFARTGKWTSPNYSGYPYREAGYPYDNEGYSRPGGPSGSDRGREIQGFGGQPPRNVGRPSNGYQPPLPLPPPQRPVPQNGSGGQLARDGGLGRLENGPSPPESPTLGNHSWLQNHPEWGNHVPRGQPARNQVEEHPWYPEGPGWRNEQQVRSGSKGMPQRGTVPSGDRHEFRPVNRYQQNAIQEPSSGRGRRPAIQRHPSGRRTPPSRSGGSEQRHRDSDRGPNVGSYEDVPKVVKTKPVGPRPRPRLKTLLPKGFQPPLSQPKQRLEDSQRSTDAFKTLPPEYFERNSTDAIETQLPDDFDDNWKFSKKDRRVVPFHHDEGSLTDNHPNDAFKTRRPSDWLEGAGNNV